MSILHFDVYLKTMWWFILAVAAVALAYGLLLLLTHTPRAPTPLELKYVTNGETGTFDLPSRISRTTLPDSEVALTVVVPCYNETQRLASMLLDATAHLNVHYKDDFEILVIDDGSTDGTAAYALAEAERLHLAPHVLRVVQLSANRGKGGAVTHGLLHGRGELLLFADADGATRFEDLARLKESIKDVAVGLRAHMVNTDAVVKRSFIRNFLMYGLHTLVFIFGIRSIKDTQCGFKLFTRAAVQKIFPCMHTERWIFDVEVLLLAELQGLHVSEVPVNWQEVDGLKVDLAKDLIQMAIDLMVTRIAYAVGIYNF